MKAFNILGKVVIIVLISIAVSAQPDVLFESDWSNSTGTGNLALTDGGKWGVRGGSGPLSVVSSAGLNFPTKNVLRAEQTGGAQAVFNDDGWDLPEIGETLYKRVYWRHGVDTFFDVTHHPVQSCVGSGSTCGDLWLHHNYPGSGNTYTFKFNMNDNAGPNNNWGPGFPTAHSGSLDIHSTYRMEWALTRLTNNTWDLDANIYEVLDNGSEVLRYNASDMRNSNGGTLLVDSPPLVTNYPNSQRDAMLGWQGGGREGVSMPGEYLYFGAFAVCENDWCGEYVGNGSVSDPGDSPDFTAPNITNSSPSGRLSQGATSTVITLETDEDATCRFSRDEGYSYDNMNSFEITGGTIHNQTIINLQGGRFYNFFAKCRDASGNTNEEDHPIRFGVDSGSVENLGDLNYDDKVDFFDVALIVREIGKKTDYLIGSDMNDDGLVDIFDIISLTKNWGTRYAPDSDPPRILKYEPRGLLPAGIERLAVEFRTDEDAVCRFSNVSGSSYDTMTDFRRSGEIDHVERVDVSDDTNYLFYIKCNDTEGNINTNDKLINFTIEGFKESQPIGVNEPSGFVEVHDFGFPQPQWAAISGSSTWQNGWDVQNLGDTLYSVDMSLASDSTAPVSPDSVLQFYYPDIAASGGGPRAVYDFTKNDHVYVRTWFKLSSDFRNDYGAWSTKMLKLEPNNVIISLVGDQIQGVTHPQDLRLMTWVAGLGPFGGYWVDNVNDVEVTRGVWHQLELELDVDNGELRWWLDGVLIGNHSGIPYPDTAGFNHLQYTPQNGGAGSPVPEDFYVWFDHARLSVENQIQSNQSNQSSASLDWFCDWRYMEGGSHEASLGRELSDPFTNECFTVRTSSSLRTLDVIPAPSGMGWPSEMANVLRINITNGTPAKLVGVENAFGPPEIGEYMLQRMYVYNDMQFGDEALNKHFFHFGNGWVPGVGWCDTAPGVGGNGCYSFRWFYPGSSVQADGSIGVGAGSMFNQAGVGPGQGQFTDGVRTNELEIWELRIYRVNSTSVYMDVQISDANGSVKQDSSDFLCSTGDPGGCVDNGGYRTQPIGQFHTNVFDWNRFTGLEVGNNGGWGPAATRYLYVGGMAVRTSNNPDDWIGTYPVGVEG